MLETIHWQRRHQRGSALISALIFVVIVSLALAGMARLAVSHYGRAQVESDYACALPLAEAGVNYEFNKVSLNSANADQVSVTNPNGVTYTLGNGTFTVYCTNRDGSTPWVPPNNLYVVCKGTINGASRTIKVSAKPFYNSANYALFAIKNGTLNGNPTVTGSVGTNGQYTFNGSPNVTGSVIFNGPGSGWQTDNSHNTYNVQYNPQPVNWPTVDQIANTDFPSGGLAWLATHNDNSLCSSISSNQILLNGNGQATFVGKPGGANYYLTSLICNGNASISFDNSNGPINIWMGPSGGTGTCILNGGSAVISMSQDPTKACRIYAATTSSVTLNGGVNLDAGIYAYNKDSHGNAYGTVTNNGTPTVNGAIITNQVTLNGNPTLNYVQGYFNATGTVNYYGFDNSWLELNPVNQ